MWAYEHAYAHRGMRDLGERKIHKVIITDEIAYVDRCSVLKMLIIYSWELCKVLSAFQS